jgi:uncharacterized DUF497 family protein
VVYEWNTAKAKANLLKHGVSFEEAAAVFLDPLALTFADPDHSLEEEREITIGNSSAGRVVGVALSARKPYTDHQRPKGYQERAKTV